MRFRMPRFVAPQQLVFRELVLQYRTIPATEPPTAQDARLRTGIDATISRGEDQPLAWLELYDLESMILRLLDDASLRHEAWSIREEFRNLATEELYKAYLDSNPPDPSNADLPQVRRDIESLLRKLHELRLGRSLLDVIRAYTTSLTFGITILLIVLTACGACINLGKFPILLFVVVGGVFGAGLSMLQRLSQIPSKGDLVSRFPSASRRVVWVLTPLLSLTQGALAAVVIFYVFRAGLLEGPMFPDFRTAVQGAQPNPAPESNAIVELLHGSIGSVPQCAKLFIWALVAGTAERLVPDLLSRLSDQAAKSELGSARS